MATSSSKYENELKRLKATSLSEQLGEDFGEISVVREVDDDELDRLKKHRSVRDFIVGESDICEEDEDDFIIEPSYVFQEEEEEGRGEGRRDPAREDSGPRSRRQRDERKRKKPPVSTSLSSQIGSQAKRHKNTNVLDLLKMNTAVAIDENALTAAVQQALVSNNDWKSKFKELKSKQKKSTDFKGVINPLNGMSLVAPSHDASPSIDIQEQLGPEQVAPEQLVAEQRPGSKLIGDKPWSETDAPTKPVDGPTADESTDMDRVTVDGAPVGGTTGGAASETDSSRFEVGVTQVVESPRPVLNKARQGEPDAALLGSLSSAELSSLMVPEAEEAPAAAPGAATSEVVERGSGASVASFMHSSCPLKCVHGRGAEAERVAEPGVLLYWYDVRELSSRGTVCLYGRVQSPSSLSATVSVHVSNVRKTVFLHPTGQNDRAHQEDQTHKDGEAGRQEYGARRLAEVQDRFVALVQDYELWKYDVKVVPVWKKLVLHERSDLLDENLWFELSFSFAFPGKLKETDLGLGGAVDVVVDPSAADKNAGYDEAVVDSFLLSNALEGPGWLYLTNLDESWMSTPKTTIYRPITNTGVPNLSIVCLAVRVIKNPGTGEVAHAVVSAIMNNRLFALGRTDHNIHQNHQRSYAALYSSDRKILSLFRNRLSKTTATLREWFDNICMWVKDHNPDIVAGHGLTMNTLPILYQVALQTKSSYWNCRDRIPINQLQRPSQVSIRR
ncbi:hypothetical protein GNI_160970 [Gregarina niphandrodes]|uniref:Uncharacterized protein n=1 Tax=Gregarina niphandrodes TaxID=110365 RepID=A0A023AYK3_GRENI|nr:hypothetical protein GNI_160970 [Gregarina niphandrodes]EZG43729.1 hypothetical protein GNI_160970 [Gregarina niphandrodes]|eukprot:XP_011133038.1 hypothetical protein GNI_160970 [Gregarina niphandrodes]